jgi:hypothetical protein
MSIAPVTRERTYTTALLRRAPAFLAPPTSNGTREVLRRISCEPHAKTMRKGCDSRRRRRGRPRWRGRGRQSRLLVANKSSVRSACGKHATHVEAAEAPLAPSVLDLVALTGEHEVHTGSTSSGNGHDVGLIAC